MVLHTKIQHQRFINMKRHPALAHLSREHHGALILARLLQKNAPAYKGLPTDTRGKADYALKFYKDELVKHFEAEEKVLNLVTGINESLDSFAGTIFREHRQLHELFSLIAGRSDDPEHLDELGRLLELHIRKEEREVFPVIEQSCNETLMRTIDATLSSAK